MRVGAYSVTTAGTQPSYPGVDDELPSTDEQVTAIDRAAADGLTTESSATEVRA